MWKTGRLTAAASRRAAAEATPASSVGTDGAAGLVTLNRPAALNALNTAMRAAMAAAFPRWARDPQIYAVVIASATDRAFCAGGDVREMAEWGRSRRADALRSLAAEYALNWQLDCFIKPTVSLIDGVVMGSGVGISLYGTHRVAGERYRFAMPETGIGLFPDDGVSWAFAAHARRDRHVSGADRALDRPGRCLPAGACHALHSRLAASTRSAPGLPMPIPSIRCSTTATRTPAPASSSPAAGHRPLLLGRQRRGHPRAPAGRDAAPAATWAAGVLAELATRSPTSLKITHRHGSRWRARSTCAPRCSRISGSPAAASRPRFLRGRARAPRRPGPRTPSGSRQRSRT